MKKMKLLSLLILAAVLGVSCSNNNAADGGKSAPADGSAGAAVGGSGSDMYYEYATTSGGGEMSMKGYTKMYFSSAGKIRVEMDMQNPAVKKTGTGPMMVLLGDKNKPGQSILVDDDKKTYTVNQIDTISDASDKTESTVTKIGEEKILGFTSVHARVISVKTMGPLGKMTDTMDIWKSPDVPMDATFRKYMELYEKKTGSFLYSPDVAAQLKQMGCEGFQMKLTSRTGHNSVNTELVKVQKGDFPGSMFDVPAGYKEDKDGL